VSLCTIAFNLE